MPPELRNKIYEMVLPKSTVHVWSYETQIVLDIDKERKLDVGPAPSKASIRVLTSSTSTRRTGMLGVRVTTRIGMLAGLVAMEIVSTLVASGDSKRLKSRSPC